MIYRWTRKSVLVGLVVIAMFVTAVPPTAQADAYHVILSGSGGEEEYQEKFRSWGTRLRDALVLRLGVPMENVALLREPETDNAPPLTTINLESIRSVFEGLSASVTEEDDLYVYLIGHGSYLKNTSKFLMPGMDMSAEELDALFDSIPAQRKVLLNATSSSAGFINVLSGPDRIICTATKSVSEFNATEFMGFFIEGLEDGSADQNHDERISFLEACEQASALTASWYTTEGLISTEHAILDDNGDGFGSRMPLEILGDVAVRDSDMDASALEYDGARAGECFLKDYQFHPDVPQELIERYLSALEGIRSLAMQKSEMDEATYFADLERLAVQAAQANREIRSFGSVADQNS